MTATQHNFDLRTESDAALYPLSAVRLLIRQDQDQILNLIEIGKLEIAFDISAPGSKRREVRVFGGSVRDYLQGISSSADPDQSLRAAITTILPRATTQFGPGRRDCYFARQLVNPLCCESQHVINLWRAGVLHGPSTARRAKQSPLVWRDSVIRFLADRQM